MPSVEPGQMLRKELMEQFTGWGDTELHPPL
jgi:hypothetical protein